MATKNMTMTLGFKGSGKPNGVAAYNPTGVYTLGGVQNKLDAQSMKFGVVVCSDPVDDDGVFSVGAVVTAGVASVFTLTVATACTLTGNIVVDGVVLALDSTVETTAALVAAAIRGMTLPRWTLTGSTTGVIFTAKSTTVYPAPTLSYLTSGVTGSLATTTAGTVGTVPRGIVLYRPDIAMNDPAKPDYVLQGVPLAVAYFGPVWIGTWTKTAAGSVDPVVGGVVIAKEDTGIIEFMVAGATAPSGWYKLANCSIKSVSPDTNGALIFVNI